MYVEVTVKMPKEVIHDFKLDEETTGYTVRIEDDGRWLVITLFRNRK
jgi:hypothetical protein